MNDSPRVPVLGYATIVLCFLGVLAWQHVHLAKAEARQDRLDIPALGSIAPGQSMVEAQQAVIDGNAQLLAAYGRARGVLKGGFLLLVVLPAAVVFPLLLAASPDPAARKMKKAVVNIKTMTRDDLDRGIPPELIEEAHPQRRIFAASFLAYGVPAAIVLAFVMARPEAYGGRYAHGIQSVLFFASTTLMVFCGAVIADSLRRKPQQNLKMALAAGYVVLAALVWFQF